MKNQIINTWLPVFPGFYSTNYEPDETMEIDHINETRWGGYGILAPDFD